MEHKALSFLLSICIPCISVLSLFVLPVSEAEAAKFVRGDANADSKVDISDGVKILNVLFLGDLKKDCDDAMDTNDSGVVDLSDGVYVFNFLFLGGSQVKAPYPDCGDDTTTDPLLCNAYDNCAQVDCFTQGDLDAVIAEQIETTYCIPADAYQTTIGALEITVCPSDKAKPCGDPPQPGWPVDFEEVQGTLDVPGKTVSIHLEGETIDLPIVVVDTLFGSTTTCENDITFSGDASVPFTTTENPDGTLTITDLGDPIIENPVVTLQSSGGLLCDLLEGQQEQFVEELVAQLQESAKDLVADLEPEVIGKTLCP